MYPSILDSSAVQPFIMLFSLALLCGGLPSLLIYIYFSGSPNSPPRNNNNLYR